MVRLFRSEDAGKTVWRQCRTFRILGNLSLSWKMCINLFEGLRLSKAQLVRSYSDSRAIFLVDVVNCLVRRTIKSMIVTRQVANSP